MSNGIPNHPTASYPNAHNPNSILEQDYHFHIPLKPKMAARPASLPFGPIGIAVNGIPFYNPYNAEGMDAVFGPYAEVFDSCCGHPDPMGRYHYHKYPVCVNSPFRDPLGKHSPLIGWAFDGFAVYGPNGEDGSPPKDLDDCNGHADLLRGYHYHVTKQFPYILGAYRGVVEMSNFEGPVWGKIILKTCGFILFIAVSVVILLWLELSPSPDTTRGITLHNDILTRVQNAKDQS